MSLDSVGRPIPGRCAFLLKLIGLLAIALVLSNNRAQAISLTVSPYYLSFPLTNVGQQSPPQKIVVKNPGTVALPIAVSISGTNLPQGPQFTQTNDCGTSVAPGGSCTVTVWFTPTRVLNFLFASVFLGDFAGSVSLNGNARALNNANVRITMDQPQSGSPLAGKVTVSGWALADNDSVTSVYYRVDGDSGYSGFYSNATYGYRRADICQAYPGRAGCPYVGWSFDLDTTSLSNGAHMLYLRAGTSASGSKVIGVPLNIANDRFTAQQVLQVDWPAANAILSGTVNLYGWAFGISNVRILADGVPLTTVNVSQSRADVCAVYSYRFPCNYSFYRNNVGWSFALDTTQLADGPHTLSFVNPTHIYNVLDSNLSTDIPVTIANFAASRSNPIRLAIDVPSAKTGDLQGLAELAGWAIADDAAISNVFVSVDGRRVGAAAYYNSRLDVCVAFPNRPGCPNVGWRYVLDTNLLADGSHQLQVTAVSSSGKAGTIQSAFTVSNAGDKSPFHAYIDYPDGSTPLSGTPSISGWAVHDNAAVNLVTISVDGVPDGNTFDNVLRPDVCALYPGRANCPRAGWTYFLNTLKFADGTHVLDVTLSSGSQHRTFSSKFTTANRAAANPTLLYVDQPSAGSGLLSGITTVSGWVVDDRNPTSITIKVDGAQLGWAYPSLPRPDVCQAYPGRVNCPNVGWSFRLDTRAIADGPHTLTVTSTGSAPQSVNLKIEVANGNTATPPSKVYIDAPIANGPVLQGITHISGWAISTTAFSVFYVSVSVDGVQTYLSPSLIEPRPDVCAVYSAAKNCPNVGWSGDLDTTQYVDGPHVLQVSANGAVATVPIVIANSVVLDPMHLTIDAAGALSGVANLWGWALSDDAAIDTVAVLIDGAAVGNASYGDSRKDVCEVYQNRRGCPNVGWHLPVDTTKLSNGSHTVSVTATSSLGEQTTQTATVTVRN